MRYLHAAAGFSTKATWIKAIRKGNYLSRLLINVHNVSKHFPKSEDTQKGQMRNKRQGVRSTKSHQAELANYYKLNEVIERKQDIFIAVYDPKNTMYTNQTGKSPVRPSRGQQNQVVTHHIDSNWTLIEKTKRRTEGDLIADGIRILLRIQERGIVPKHQVLDN